jgi:hypothetical protein
MLLLHKGHLMFLQIHLVTSEALFSASSFFYSCHSLVLPSTRRAPGAAAEHGRKSYYCHEDSTGRSSRREHVLRHPKVEQPDDIDLLPWHRRAFASHVHGYGWSLHRRSCKGFVAEEPADPRSSARARAALVGEAELGGGSSPSILTSHYC